MRLHVALLPLAALLSIGCGDSSNGETASAGASGATTGGGAGASAGPTGSGGSGAGSSSGATGSSSASGGGAPLPVDECATAAPEWVFCSGLEEGNKDIWDDYDNNPDDTNQLIEDPGPFGNADNHVMRLRVPPGRGGADLVKVLPPHDKLYARWYIQYEPGFDFAAPNHGGGLHAGSRDLLGRSDFQPNGADWFTAWSEYDPELVAPYVYSYYPGMYMDCADPNGACWGDHFPCMIDEGENYCTNPDHREKAAPIQLVTGQWYCVELMLDGGSPTPSADGASGVLGFSVDGAQIGPWENLWLRSSADLQIEILWLSLFHHDEHSVEGVMYDHVVVSTAPIGCNAN